MLDELTPVNGVVPGHFIVRLRPNGALIEMDAPRLSPSGRLVYIADLQGREVPGMWMPAADVEIIEVLGETKP